MGYKSKDSLVEFSKGSDILIIETSLLKDKSSDIHLNTYQTAFIAKEANIGKLIVTHFWPEIPKDEYLKEVKEIFEN